MYCMFAVADTILVVRACKKRKREKKDLNGQARFFFCVDILLSWIPLIDGEPPTLMRESIMDLE